ncbi:hypothetical protein TRIUR3_18400 [Triticum urartu]|uniref:Uncharacterized protein n=1 Tax=Triticum urartu TaxID=4572 RepID=M7YT04_TRIUA|nr:hypothetical protein TRIUR3_18400 [Triticum urartu]
MAMASKMVGALLLVLLLALTQSDAQVLPTPCCNLKCCGFDCCGPPVTVAAPISPLSATPEAGPAGAVSQRVPHKVFPGN